MRTLAVTAAVLALVVVAPAAGHNAGHVITPSGACIDLGSGNPGPVVPASNPNRNSSTDPGRLDLIDGPGDQYGARFAAAQGQSAVLPGGCP